MRKSELKSIIKECLGELNEATDDPDPRDKLPSKYSRFNYFKLSASDKKTANTTYKFLMKFGQLHDKEKQKMPSDVLKASTLVQDYLYKFL